MSWLRLAQSTRRDSDWHNPHVIQTVQSTCDSDWSNPHVIQICPIHTSRFRLVQSTCRDSDWSSPHVIQIDTIHMSWFGLIQSTCHDSDWSNPHVVIQFDPVHMWFKLAQSTCDSDWSNPRVVIQFDPVHMWFWLIQSTCRDSDWSNPRLPKILFSILIFFLYKLIFWSCPFLASYQIITLYELPQMLSQLVHAHFQTSYRTRDLSVLHTASFQQNTLLSSLLMYFCYVQKSCLWSVIYIPYFKGKFAQSSSYVFLSFVCSVMYILYSSCQLAFSGYPDWGFSVLFPQL
jgi:hypothetical protein